MKENPYDNPSFFTQYSRMDRSRKGLAGAGEWPTLKTMLPALAGKRVLDLGCGYGWHCRYALEQGAAEAVGVDLSQRMLEEAARRTTSERCRYLRMAMEDIDFPRESFDVAISSLALHYVADYAGVLRRVAACLKSGGDFVFSVEHPVFTAYGNQDWYRDSAGQALHWPVDRYFLEGERQAVFLGERMTKYHRTLTGYVKPLMEAGFALTGLAEPQPTEQMLSEVAGMADELRRPMMLILAAKRL